MKTLLVAFEPSDLATSSGFCEALGQAWDAVTVPTDLLADVAASAVSALCEGYTHVVAVSSMRSKDVMARVAGLVDCAMVTDAIGTTSPTVFTRPIIAGTVIAEVEVLELPVVMTFRPGGFAAGTSAPTTTHTLAPSSSKVTRMSADVRGGSRPDLTQAKRVVSGGRPLRDASTFEQVIGGLADKLGGAVGATRAAVDSGIAPNELQVGQTGKIVAPDLYIAAGISGSTQHMAGIKDSKCIVAINKDPDAPIFEVADLGLVADLFDAVPELTSKLD